MKEKIKKYISVVNRKHLGVLCGCRGLEIDPGSILLVISKEIGDIV